MSRSEKSEVGSSSAPRVIFPWMMLASLTFGAAIFVSLAVAAWGAYVDFEEARISVLQVHLNRLRSHATRTVVMIQDQLQSEPNRGNLRALVDIDWLREHWNRFIPQDASRLYAAVIDEQGRIVLHSRRDLEGGALDANWRREPTSENAEDVAETTDRRLTGGLPALDIEIPIIFDRREIGTYHSGFNRQWFEAEVSRRGQAARNRWTVAFVVIATVIVLAGFSLFQIARRLSQLQTAVVVGRVRRLADLGQLAGGIAHEIRNPLNIMRLNLHVVKKLVARLDVEKRVEQVMDETVQEMERVDGLLRSLLEYARPDQPKRELVDLTVELRSVAEFLRPLIEGQRLTMTGEIPPRPLICECDRGRFRQIVMNLLKNAIEAVPREGNINFELREADYTAELIVRDDGPGVPTADVDRIFDAFFTTKELGTGLGLVLVKRFAEEAGGTVRYEPAKPRGAKFIVALPLAAAIDAQPAPMIAATAAAP